MPYITTCCICGRCYEETSEEQANAPVRACKACWIARQNEEDGRRFDESSGVVKELDTPDGLGFIQTASDRLLAAVARGEVDLNRLALAELASRGLDCDGVWVGFERARDIHGR